jgi:hypothetical protein
MPFVPSGKDWNSIVALLGSSHLYSLFQLFETNNIIFGIKNTTQMFQQLFGKKKWCLAAGSRQHSSLNYQSPIS